jgi:glycerophosphoryl diester phosphodiesterase
MPHREITPQIRFRSQPKVTRPYGTLSAEKVSPVRGSQTQHLHNAHRYNLTRVNNLPILLGHRGTRASAIRENTLPAFEMALQHGCDGFEFDVRLTRDGRAVVCHNPRSRGISLARAGIARLGRLPLLEDVIARFAKLAFLDIELKVPGLEQHVLTLLRENVPERGYVVSSFLPKVLVELRARSETVLLGIIFDKKTTKWRDLPVNYVIPRKSLVTAALVNEVHDAGKLLITWTVNDKRSMLRLANWGVDGIISDKTELLFKTLRPDQKPNFGSSIED